jgi:hypothetical protein
MPGTPAAFHQKDAFSLPSEATQADVFKRKDLPFIWHIGMRARTCQPKASMSGARLFSDSRSHCQEQNSGRFQGDC